MCKWLILFLLCSIMCVHAQKNDEFNIDLYKQTITCVGYKATFQTAQPNRQLRSLNATKWYHWYSSNAIKVTQGGYNGKLLNGLFTAQYLNGNLKEQGKFVMGLKEGEWNSWNEDGAIISKNNFREGILHGVFMNYVKGKLIEVGNYKNGKINGVLKKYNTKDSVIFAKYEDGIECPSVKKLAWFKRFFAKKNN